MWKRLRDEAPLYWNEKYEFFALSRWDDVDAAMLDWKTYISGRGSVLEIIKAGVEIPPGSILFEDPPTHDLHRGLLSRVFTPKKMQALEPQVRAFCAQVLDPLVGSGGFDFIADLGKFMPMRVIGMLLGIPEQDQEAIRDRLDEGLRLEEGVPNETEYDGAAQSEVFSDYITWRAEHPSDDLMTELLNAEFEDEHGHDAHAHPRGDPRLRRPAGGGRERDHDPPDRLHRRGPRAAIPTSGPSWWRTGR